MAQSIEFFLHPPSPKSTIDHCTLPPVSSLLHETNIPSLCLSPASSVTSDSLDLYPIHETTSLPSLSPFMDSLSLDSPPPPPPTSPHCRLLLPLPTNTRTRSLSNASSSSSCSLNSILNDPIDPPKRKRGRPPNSNRPATQRDHWTFVTPTVWDVKHTQLIDPKPEKDDYTVLHWPVQEGQNDFTNTSMNTSLSMPKKKRGRKPKMQLAGNFCFVWRDLTARRSANRKKTNHI
ncbi:hypothetical protein MFLAVUS_004860 [Mucor flavus]|uniref:Uncharacterized protein n=1 Tax=Mucor flavus TaxID=439312 RepID=A0ABP9YX35_9FUNG